MPRPSPPWDDIFAHMRATSASAAQAAEHFGIPAATIRPAAKREGEKAGGGRLAGHPTYGAASAPLPADAATAPAVDVPLAQLVPWARNPKKHGEADAVAASIIRFGFGAPVLARLADREVIAGHGRIAAVRSLPKRHAALQKRVDAGDAEAREALARWHPQAVALATGATPSLPVRYMDLTEDEGHALALTDNRTAELSGWDEALLADVLRDFRARSVATTSLGWDQSVLDAMLTDDVARPGGGNALPGNDGNRIEWPADWPPPLLAPFPWFGGKLRAALLIWQALGTDVPNYVEPFLGSCATLLARPPDPDGARRTETVNDADGFVANFWRAVALDPEATALAADWPVSEADLSARHLWLVKQRTDLTERLQVDPEHFDAKIAGWWVWGICSWIGSGWCSGEGPWSEEEGRWVDRRAATPDAASTGSSPDLGNAGRGINRKLPHLGDAGQGINRQLPHLGDAGQGILDAFALLSARLRTARITCGDWRRVLSESVTIRHGTTGVLLDPPYADGFSADGGAYSAGSAGVDVWHEAAAWAVENGGDKRLRIVLCGYEGTWTTPSGWREVPWKARGGYGSATSAGAENSARERLWLSPGCLDVRTP